MWVLVSCRMESTAVARVSDDFYPTNAASWNCHLGICAYNSLFMGALVLVCPAPALNASLTMLPFGPAVAAVLPCPASAFCLLGLCPTDSLIGLMLASCPLHICFGYAFGPAAATTH